MGEILTVEVDDDICRGGEILAPEDKNAETRGGRGSKAGERLVGGIVGVVLTIVGEGATGKRAAAAVSASLLAICRSR
jgi:hypothetical protein